MAKRCREPDDCDLGPTARFRRDDDCLMVPHQTGRGSAAQPHYTLNPSEPCMGLTQADIESLVRDGGDVAGRLTPYLSDEEP
ncbi:hypothetical protein QQF64_027204 [Cirrhinus molitorella]|uniref:Uncharacterized protein n=1 Tax=Cirrhinus molitorella TaxID=172907 RepID=A0ABR3NCH0_9TELE